MTRDAEDEAIAELGARRERLQRRILLPFIIGGVAAWIPAYFVARAVQFAVWHAASVLFSGLTASALTAAVVVAGILLTRAATRARQPGWITEIARAHGVPEDDLRELSDAIRI